MRNGGAGQGHGDHVLLGSLQTLADRFGNFSSFAKAVTDLAFSVADDHQRGELHDTAALNGLGNTVEGNELFHVFARFTFKSGHFVVPPS